MDLPKIANRIAILMRPNRPAKIDFQIHTDDQGFEIGGEVIVSFPDGSTIRGTYEVINGVGSWRRGVGGPGQQPKDEFENNSPLSDEDALKILEAAHDLYWEEGGEGGGPPIDVDLSKLDVDPYLLNSFKFD